MRRTIHRRQAACLPHRQARVTQPMLAGPNRIVTDPEPYAAGGIVNRENTFRAFLK